MDKQAACHNPKKACWHPLISHRLGKASMEGEEKMRLLFGSALNFEAHIDKSQI